MLSDARCGAAWGSLTCELRPHDRKTNHACAIGWDDDGRVDDGITWRDKTFAERCPYRIRAFFSFIARNPEVPF